LSFTQKANGSEEESQQEEAEKEVNDTQRLRSRRRFNFF
jgi:hypothetical protein